MPYGQREFFRPERHYSRQNISRGDRMFVRVTHQGSTVLETFLDNVDSYTELIGEIRSRMHGRSGLAKLWIRNHSQGWSQEKPLMFYPPKRNPSAIPPKRPVSRMAAPWETH